MCFFPKLIKNKRYTNTKKNRGNIPPVNDDRTLYVPIGCGECMECRQKKGREWQTRLLEDIKENKHGKFITLTFSDESIAELTEDVNNWILHNGKRIKQKRNLTGYILDNEIAKRAMRLFNERWRKHTGKALRHWLVTELGHNGTENIHLHGIVWVDLPRLEAYKLLEEKWQFGHIWPRNEKERLTTYVNEKTVGYTVKYVSKKDLKHKHYKPIILTSAGIGGNYIKKLTVAHNKFVPLKTKEYYRTTTGHKVGLPIYWRNKLYTEEQREKLWLEKLDREERFVLGQKVSIKNGTEELDKLVNEAREKNKWLGYGNGERNMEQEEYERERRILMQKTRVIKAMREKPPAGYVPRRDGQDLD